MSYEAGGVSGWNIWAGAALPGTRAELIAAAAIALLLAWTPAAVAGPPSCGKDFYGSVWVHAPGWSWPSDVLVPAYGSGPSPLDEPNLQGDGARDSNGDRLWYTHGGTKRNQIAATFQVSGCDYPKFDFTLNLLNSTRQLFATVPDHTIDPYFLNVDRMASVPITTDNQAFRTFCGGSGAQTIVLNTPQLVPRPDGYPDVVDGVLMDNYGGCFRDGADQYYVRRMMAVQSDEDGRGLSVSVLGRSPIRDGGSAMDCDECSSTSFVRIYHPDADTWVVVPEFEHVPPTPPADDPGYPWQAAYQRRVDNNWVYEQYAPLPFAMVVKRLP
jgi:hypothetical protein